MLLLFLFSPSPEFKRFQVCRLLKKIINQYCGNKQVTDVLYPNRIIECKQNLTKTKMNRTKKYAQNEDEKNSD